MAVVSGATRIAAVIGSPVSHSLSPAIHNAGFQALGLDWAYAAFDVGPGQAAGALEAMRVLHLGGLSVTMPHKADVAAAVDQRSIAASVLGAVNCVSWDKGQLVGHNTDGEGFVASLVEAYGESAVGKSCVVLGAGGAAKAVIQALGAGGATEVVVINRTPAKAAAAAELAGSCGRVGDADDINNADLVVNATSLGMASTSGAGICPVDPSRLGPHQIVADLVYHPLSTPLLEAARAAGSAPLDGIGMLVHQAAAQFSLWTGHEAPVAAMTNAARAALGSS